MLYYKGIMFLKVLLLVRQVYPKDALDKGLGFDKLSVMVVMMY